MAGCVLFSARVHAVPPPVPSAPSPVQGASEEKLKAIYMVHVSRLTTWPERKEVSPDFSICINESIEISKMLEKIEGRPVKNERNLKLQHDLSLPNLIDCDVFYVGEGELSIFEKSRVQLESNSVLTVSDQPGFSDEGGIIRYYLDEDRVKMSINLQAMRRSNIEISSKLLRLMDTRH